MNKLFEFEFKWVLICLDWSGDWHEWGLGALLRGNRGYIGFHVMMLWARFYVGIARERTYE